MTTAADRPDGVEWRDLMALSPRDIVLELALPLPWLAASLFLADRGWWFLALPFSFVFFLAGLRIAHNAFHYALGLSRTGTEGMMALFSILMLGSMHAVQWNHLRHHKYCLGDGDVEGSSVRLGALGAVAIGPLFPLRLHRKALREAAPRMVRWVRAELLGNLVWVVLVFLLLDSAALRYHVIAMAAGQCLTAFFAVWTVHHGCEDTRAVGRTLRGRLKTAMTFSMFFHAEHHLYPQVPTRRLHVLSARLDPAMPHLRDMLVF
jgi:fatty acid desaturase